MAVQRILYVGCGAGSTERFIADLETSGAIVSSTSRATTLECERGQLELVSASDGATALEQLRTHYINAVLLDLRCASSQSWSATTAGGRALLDALDDTDDVEARYGFHRILGLVGGSGGGEASPSLDDFIAELGARGVRHIRRLRPDQDATAFPHRVVCDAVDLIGTRRKGGRALCASGGGITGIYFELAALKCLGDALPPGALSSFDMYFGISAGAVVNTLMAMGFSPAEVMAAIGDRPDSSSGRPRHEGRLPLIDLSLLKLGHLNVPDFARRARAAGAAALRQLSTLVRGDLRRSVEDAFLEYTALIGPPFRSDEFERLLRELLEAPGATNRFEDLQERLFIGASDQDLRKHVLFGASPNDQMPISRAVQASLSIHPAFSSVEIDGRWYEDGAVTRTSGFTEAIDRGANLIFVLDPFVPYVSPAAGAANRRGVLYNLDQELRTISFTRFYGTRSWALRKHPDVSSYTFLPSNRSRRLLSINPMDHRPYLAIWKDAYLSTLRRLEHLAHRLRGDLAAHGLALDLGTPREVGRRLRAADGPRFEDFFVDGRVNIEMRPLVMHARP